jgi:hypothetical protein
LVILVCILKGNEMTESKFTEGPWRVDGTIHRNGLSYRIIGGDNISLGFTATVLSWCHNFETTKANAELMAEAPRMLEVLRALHDFALPLRDRGLAAESEQAFADARALLEKHGG